MLAFIYGDSDNDDVKGGEGVITERRVWERLHGKMGNPTIFVSTKKAYVRVFVRSLHSHSRVPLLLLLLSCHIAYVVGDFLSFPLFFFIFYSFSPQCSWTKQSAVTGLLPYSPTPYDSYPALAVTSFALLCLCDIFDHRLSSCAWTALIFSSFYCT